MTDEDQRPQIKAVYAVRFDFKSGYVLDFKLPRDAELQGVEFKSLPSGLQNVPEDVVYFAHPPLAGVCAFENATMSSEARGSRMVAVGILVSTGGTSGRLGHSWRHVGSLRQLAKQYVQTLDTEPIERFYSENSRLLPQINKADPVARTMTHGRLRSVSDTGAIHRSRFEEEHPALSLIEMLFALGPLIFPLYRAALCRQRVLFLMKPPVKRACHYVYNTSVLGTVPPNVSSLLAVEPTRLRTLFTIGVNDIAYLQELKHTSRPRTAASAVLSQSSAAESSGNEDEDREDDDMDEYLASKGWVACTTDSVLSFKTGLYDTIFTVPVTEQEGGSAPALPEMRSRWRKSRRQRKADADGMVPVEPTRRDVRKFIRLCRLLQVRDARMEQARVRAEQQYLQSKTWLERAREGIFWWASGGETLSKIMREYTEEEQMEDEMLFYEDDGDDMYSVNRIDSEQDPRTEDAPPRVLPESNYRPFDPNLRSVRGNEQESVPLRQNVSMHGPDMGERVSSGEDERHAQVDLIMYFHRMTARLLATMGTRFEQEMDDDTEVHSGFHDTSSDGTTHSGEQQPDEPLISRLQRETRFSLAFEAADFSMLGLDINEPQDVAFVKQLARRWFRQQVSIAQRPLLHRLLSLSTLFKVLVALIGGLVLRILF